MLYLSHLDILELVNAAVDADLGRDALLSGLPPRTVSELRVSNKPLEQLTLDLHSLNVMGRLKDGRLPLELWLLNAQGLVVVDALQKIFTDKLEKLRQRLMEVPLQLADATVDLPPLSLTYVQCDRDLQWKVLSGILNQPGSHVLCLPGPEEEAHLTLVERLRLEFPGHWFPNFIDIRWPTGDEIPATSSDFLSSLARALGHAHDADLSKVMHQQSPGVRSIFVHPLAQVAGPEDVEELLRYYGQYLAGFVGRTSYNQKLPGPIFIQPLSWPGAQSRDFEPIKKQVLTQLRAMERQHPGPEYRFTLLPELKPITPDDVSAFLLPYMQPERIDEVMSGMRTLGSSSDILNYLRKNAA